jgi:hypothetical protein
MGFGVLSPLAGEMAAERPEGVASEGDPVPSFMNDPTRRAWPADVPQGGGERRA